MNPALALQPLDWLQFLLFFLSLSLLAVGGAMSTAPEMHRHLVQQQGWLTDVQFNQSIAIAQSAPGPNMLYIALLGWNVGLNAAPAPHWAWATASLGLVLAMVGTLAPSTLLTWAAARWAQRNRQRRSVRAFKLGMAPVVVGLMLATAWVLARPQLAPDEGWPLWVLSALTAAIVWRTRVHLLWLLAAGALLGALGWV